MKFNATRYKRLFDDCLVIPLQNKRNDGKIWEIQIRQCNSLTHFSIQITDGYNIKGIKHVQGWKHLKNVLKTIVATHNRWFEVVA